MPKVLEANPSILILDEPTHGVDVGAKAEIYQIMDGSSLGPEKHHAISTDLPEVIGMSDRVGHHEGEPYGPGNTKIRDESEIILAHASGGVSENE